MALIKLTIFHIFSGNKKRIFQPIFLVFIFWFNQVTAQVDREFWFAIPKETDGHSVITAANNVSFKIAAMSLDARVTISMPANPAFPIRQFIVPAGQSRVEMLAQTFVEFADIYNNNSGLGVNTSTGKTNRGILIEADNDITVYYDYDNAQNRDLFSLKGKNALGTEFFTPFQTIWTDDGYNPDPMSSIEIVATEDNTIIDIIPTVQFQGRPDANPFQITLDRGEAYTLARHGTLSRPAGTKISTNNKKISVIINDDSVKKTGKGCKDILGDQLVPTNIIGTKYMVMTGALTTTNATPGFKNTSRGEQVFVTATQDNSTISYYDKDGVFLTSVVLNKGQTDYFSPDILQANQTSIYIECTDPSKKFYVFHVTGIGCELGGALLPPITDCTGSSEVTFYRSNTVNDITVNIMIPYDKTMPFNDPSQSHNFFTIYEGANITPIPGTWFEENPAAGWAVLKIANRNFNAVTTKDKAHKVVNTKDFFHLGITNGTPGSTNKYGYFSSFNVARAEVRVASTETKEYIGCFGQPITLVAKGGLEYTWHYGSPAGPPTYLSDPKSANPDVIGAPNGSHNYYVEIRQAKCFGIDTSKVNVTILPRTTARFEVDKSYICAIDTVKFTNQSEEAQLYYWKKQIDNLPPLNYHPSNDLLFQEILDNKSSTTPVRIRYTLTAEHNQGCNDTTSKVITVYPRINADFSPSVIEGCHPLSVNFTDKSGGNLDLYTWDFGDQGSSTLSDPQHTYEHFGATDTIFNAKLTVKSPFFCTDDTTRQIRVFPYLKAGFTVDTVKGCSPLTIKVYNNSQNRKAISDYTWDFGDGVIRSVNQDTLWHTYPVNTSSTPINYKLLLTVKHPYNTGCPDTISRQITVYPQSAIDFIPNPNPAGYCDSTEVQFTAIPSAAITSYLWEFGDGNTSTLQNPKHLFTNLTTSDKTYTVKLTGMSSEYCNGYASKSFTVHAFLDPQMAIDLPTSCAPFNANIKNKSRGGITKYEWWYGDGGHDFHQVIDTIHKYRNTTNVVFAPLVKLVVTNSGGCKDSVSQRINVYPEIKADFTPSVIFGCNPLPVNFTNKSTFINQVSKYFKWNFGDSTSSTLQNPSHIFENTTSNAATFKVKLTVSSEFNCTSDTVKDITVLPYLEAKFSVDSVKGCSPYPVYIHNASRGNITQYQWVYNDGNVDNHTSAFFTHTYDNNSVNNPSNIPIQKYIHLTVSNTNGLCKSKDSVLITIYPEVVSSFTTDVIEGCNPLKVKFTNTSGPGTVPVEYNWIFGDGGTAVNQSTSHTFENLTSAEKVFQTRLLSYSMYKCVDTSKVDITVYPFIQADFSFDKPVGCSPHTISITNASSSGVNGYHWLFDDGQVSTVSAPVFNHIYRNLGSAPRIFNPKLIVDYNGLCQDTIEQSLQVFPEVTALFTQDTLKGCHPIEITLTNQSSNADRYNWSFGDKGTSVIASPKHTYTNFSNVDSVYNLSLTATSIFNCKNTLTKQVSIYAKPKALLDVENSVNCPPFLLPIKNLSEAGDFYYWNFGDGDSILSINLSPVSHTYDNLTANTATYNLKLFVQSVHNCTDEITQSINVYPRVIADFKPDTSGCSPLLVPLINNSLRAITYKWDFGDEITSALRDPSHKFFNNSLNDTTFNVRMVGFSKFGCSDTAFRNVLVHPQPTVEFSALPSHLYYPDARVNIDNQTNPGSWNYLWTYDDGQSSVEIEPGSHEYLHWGNFNIQLKAWSDYCTDSVSHRIRVYAPKTIADFDASQSGCEPLTVNFTNHSTWATSYKWEFDDGSVSTEKNPSHIYQEPGKYQIKLTTYGDGAEDATYREIEVYPKPLVEFNVSPRYVMLPNALVHAYNTSKLGSKYLWDFGDGSTSEEIEPTHTYKDLGTFDITLNVWTEHQCFDSVVMQRAVKVEGTGVCEFPNAFTPSAEGASDGSYDYPDTKNTVFHPYHDGVEEYTLEVYDRLGEKLFETTDITKGWDGYFKGRLCESDVYIWKAKGKFYNGSSFNKAGDVTLLR